jgi:hypothetical protein
VDGQKLLAVTRAVIQKLLRKLVLRLIKANLQLFSKSLIQQECYSKHVIEKQTPLTSIRILELIDPIDPTPSLT